jgi:hypothetical protein
MVSSIYIEDYTTRRQAKPWIKYMPNHLCFPVPGPNTEQRVQLRPLAIKIQTPYPDIFDS